MTPKPDFALHRAVDDPRRASDMSKKSTVGHRPLLNHFGFALHLVLLQVLAVPAFASPVDDDEDRMHAYTPSMCEKIINLLLCR